MTPFLVWRKSSHSDGTGGECVEIAAGPGMLLIRDSKDPDGPRLGLTVNAMQDLINRLQKD
ncbi:DUF397 domain-containing protein [Actinomadura darangshiensis]|uniref:DUF397 domain-containing protein n=1 Tax=Actinomadura darangshiensis TaxID=705336 RepID=A0A4R5BFJ6_9ACTN|nr:DUF397 domain-containing protein [Actinomadura darangshiensis]TDD85121.1 DUF397 domain-containing protein [Actinomadura darangshiensis]